MVVSGSAVRARSTAPLTAGCWLGFVCGGRGSRCLRRRGLPVCALHVALPLGPLGRRPPPRPRLRHPDRLGPQLQRVIVQRSRVDHKRVGVVVARMGGVHRGRCGGCKESGRQADGQETPTGARIIGANEPGGQRE